VVVKNNTIQYNNGYGVESYALKNGEISKNTYEGNLHVKTPEKISREGKILMN
jgi:parallel beta-helix repeat protein